MGDLISRSALIEAITQHGKDIKSDVPMIKDIYQTAHKHIIDLVEIQPTAFDVEKVIEELETFANLAEDRWVNGTSNHAYQEHKCWVKACDIVKRGGAECLKERS